MWEWQLKPMYTGNYVLNCSYAATVINHRYSIANWIVYVMYIDIAIYCNQRYV